MDKVQNKEDGIQIISKWRNVLMGFSALWIFIFHEWMPVLQEAGFAGEIEGFIKRIGFCGVDIFLLLSGMGMTYAIHKSNLLQFYWHRIKRVMLPFVLFGILVGVIDHWRIVDFFKNLLGVNFYTQDIYSFLWFVPAIMTFYLMFPIYYYFFQKSKHPVLFTVGAIEVWLVISMLLKDTLRLDLFGFTNRIPIFLIGILFGWLCQNKKIVFGKGMWGFFAITLILGGYLSYLCNFQGLEILIPVSNCCLPNILMTISLSFLIAKAFDMLSRRNYLKTIAFVLGKFLTFFGMMSLEFYCVQEWLVLKIREYDGFPANTMVGNLIQFVFVCVAGLILFAICKIVRGDIIKKKHV